MVNIDDIIRNYNYMHMRKIQNKCFFFTLISYVFLFFFDDNHLVDPILLNEYLF